MTIIETMVLGKSTKCVVLILSKPTSSESVEFSKGLNSANRLISLVLGITGRKISYAGFRNSRMK